MSWFFVFIYIPLVVVSGAATLSLQAQITDVPPFHIAYEGNISPSEASSTEHDIESLSSESSAIAIVPTTAATKPQRMRYAGTNEFTVTAGVSRMSGHWLGYRKEVDMEAINLRYARLIKNGRHFTAFYSTEVTPYINLEEPLYNDDDAGNAVISRKQTVGGGITPVGFTFDFLPTHRIQPFWRCNYGVLYFHDRVLSPQGSQFMHTVDFGVGIQLYKARNISTALGFRYIHMSNADISEHNPGTDAETFYIGFSRFYSRKSSNNVY